MTEPRSQRLTGDRRRLPASDGIGPRVDPPHEFAWTTDSPPHEQPSPLPVEVQPDLAQPAPGPVLEESADFWRLQLRELSLALDARQAELDRRETLVRTQEASLESQLRGARLWAAEREAELATQQTAIDTQAEELRTREQELRASAEELDTRRTELNRLDATLRQRSEELAQARSELRNAQPPAEVGVTAAEREAFRTYVAERTAAIEAQARLDRQRLAAWQRSWQEEHERQQAELQSREEEVAARHAALEQLRSDLHRQQAEALEERLACEELLAELRGAGHSASLVARLADLRARLADHRQFADSDLARRAAEVESLRSDLLQQASALVGERQELQAWVARRERELQQTARALAERETEGRKASRGIG